MAEYSLGFSESLLKAADFMLQDAAKSVDGKRAVLYLSLLSCEISLKAALEKAGIPVKDIMKCSHRHDQLLEMAIKCEVPAKGMTPERWIPASSPMALAIKVDGGQSTVG